MTDLILVLTSIVLVVVSVTFVISTAQYEFCGIDCAEKVDVSVIGLRTTGPAGEAVWTFEDVMPSRKNSLPLISLYEVLDYMADRFHGFKMQKLLNITFEQYLAAPDLYDAQAEALRNGDGINTVAGAARIVPLKTGKATRKAMALD